MARCVNALACASEKDHKLIKNYLESESFEVVVGEEEDNLLSMEYNSRNFSNADVLSEALGKDLEEGVTISYEVRDNHLYGIFFITDEGWEEIYIQPIYVSEISEEDHPMYRDKYEVMDELLRAYIEEEVKDPRVLYRSKVR